MRGVQEAESKLNLNQSSLIDDPGSPYFEIDEEIICMFCFCEIDTSKQNIRYHSAGLEPLHQRRILIHLEDHEE